MEVDDDGGDVISSEPMPGNPWPHDMVLTIEDHPAALLELLWVREAWGLEPAGDDLPPRLVDGPPREIDRFGGDEPAGDGSDRDGSGRVGSGRVGSGRVGSDGDPLDVGAWSAGWAEIWSACLAHAAAEQDRAAIERLHGSTLGQAERTALLARVVGPSWHEVFGDGAITERFHEWTSASMRIPRSRRPLERQPERVCLDALVPAWRAGLTRVVVLPCRGSFTRRVGASAMVVTAETRDDPVRYTAALRSFG